MTEEEQRKLKQIYLRRLKKITKARSDGLIGNIKEAFANVLYPGNENLISTPEHRASCGECQKLYDYFVGKTWEETLDEKSFGWLSHAKSFFLPLAWKYYLPAFLIQLINQQQFFAEHHFLPTENPELLIWREERVDILTSWQCDVIIEYLEIADELWREIDDYKEEHNQKALNFWKENYRKALAKEKITE
jgi:hypothetical protein